MKKDVLKFGWEREKERNQGGTVERNKNNFRRNGQIRRDSC